MAANAMLFDRESLDRGNCIQVWLGLDSAISPVQNGVNGENVGNLWDTPVPLGVRGRYYPQSKPGGPLSQDTHTSSGLSIYGLGVCT